jgi:hypothetical protein
MNEEVTDINELISVINNIQVYKTSASAIYKIYGFREHYLHHMQVSKTQQKIHKTTGTSILVLAYVQLRLFGLEYICIVHLTLCILHTAPLLSNKFVYTYFLIYY